MQLKIRTQPALIAWNRTPAKQTTPAIPKDTLKLDIKEPKMNMTSKKPQVKIDQEQAFNESGLKNNKAFLDDMVSRSKQAVMDGIAHVVEDGNTLMAIENGTDAIAEQAVYNTWERFYHEFGLVTMPQTRPVISVEEGNVDYQFQEGSVEILNGVLQIDKGTYEAGKIEYYLKQKNSIEITPVGDEVDISL